MQQCFCLSKDLQNTKLSSNNICSVTTLDAGKCAGEQKEKRKTVCPKSCYWNWKEHFSTGTSESDTQDVTFYLKKEFSNQNFHFDSFRRFLTKVHLPKMELSETQENISNIRVLTCD